jgi:hypothetical protein
MGGSVGRQSINDLITEYTGLYKQGRLTIVTAAGCDACLYMVNARSMIQSLN